MIEFKRDSKGNLFSYENNKKSGIVITMGDNVKKEEGETNVKSSV